MNPYTELKQTESCAVQYNCRRLLDQQLDGLLAARWPGSAVIDSLLEDVVHGPVALSSPIVNAGFWFLEVVAGVVAL